MAALAAIPLIGPMLAGAGGAVASVVPFGATGAALTTTTSAAASGGTSLAGILSGLSAAATIAGAGISTVGALAQGKAEASAALARGAAAKEAADFEASQLEIRAKEERAAAMFEYGQRQKAKRRLLSDFQARAAGSGLSADDPTSIQKSDEIERYGDLQAQFAKYGGDVRAKNFQLSADASRYSGDSAYNAGYQTASSYRSGAGYSALSSIISGGANAFDRFRQRSTLQRGLTPTGRYGGYR